MVFLTSLTQEISIFTKLDYDLQRLLVQPSSV
ncbi:unnamed protein product [Blumeria hordei]|uniref:Uncharacterized protein n=1 Tax=Blumeria hordei TaxID=2867405 RepID=A0A383ULJ3_BLUHO|nr:unnamed protein product [Blumeria hordei]